MNSTWYVVKPDRELGPYTHTQMKQLAAAGQLTSEDLVRRADQATTVKAGTISGLFSGTQVAAGPQAVPPPLPSERGTFTDRMRRTAANLAETTKAAGQLAAAEAHKVKLKTISLPAAYLALGREIHASGRFRAEFPELYSEIEAVQAEITRLTTGHEVKTGGTFAEKAKQTASGMKDAAQAKALGLKVDSLLRRLGETAFAVHGHASGQGQAVTGVTDCLSKIQDAEEEIRLQSAVGQERRVTPRRLLLGGGALVIFFLAIGLMNHPSRMSAPAQSMASCDSSDSRPSGVRPDETSPERPVASSSVVRTSFSPSDDQTKVERPDFSKVDYSYDFSKDDTTPPSGLKVETRFKKMDTSDTQRTDESDENLEGTWASEEGYIAQDGTFTLHGHRTLWYDQEKQKKAREDSWLNGKPHGLRTMWHDNGKKKLEATFVRGKVHGPVRRWDREGQLTLESAFLNNLTHALRVEYYSNGKKKQEVAYLKGLKEGVLQAWYENGQIQELSYFHNDKYEGAFKGWTDEGTLYAELSYRDGEQHGESTYYFGRGPNKGKKIGTVIYDTGKIIKPMLNPHRLTKSEFIRMMLDASLGYTEQPSVYALWTQSSWFETFGDPDRIINKGRGAGPSGEHLVYQCSDGFISLHYKPGMTREDQMVLEID